MEEDGAYKLDGNGVNSIKDYSVRCKVRYHWLLVLNGDGKIPNVHT